jgi:hypothetical protein
MDKRSKTARADRLATVIKAIGKELKDVDSLTLDGQDITPEALASALQEELDALRAVDHAWGVYLRAIGHEKDLKARNKPLLRDLEIYVRLRAGNNAVRLAPFHLEPPKKPGRKSAATKAAAAEKAVETRKLRGTMGPKQRRKAPKG